MDRALFGTPVTTIFSLIPCVVERRGGEEGPGFADHAVIAARRKAEAVLREEFRIIPNPS